MKQARLNKSGWISLGITALRENGPDCLIVEELCRIADKTRGSFYFHFGTIDDFLNALAENWLEEFTHRIIRHPAPATKRLDLLNRIAARTDPRLETGIRKLAARNERVQEWVAEADRLRIEWLAGLYVRTGKYDENEALMLAKTEYAAFTGFRLIDPGMSADEARLLYENFIQLTGRD